ncbi:aspartic peptidase domain-containing protein [Podospora conica]|nr:aspartic peptidase domain-containing protein [Schizothecium conicum]
MASHKRRGAVWALLITAATSQLLLPLSRQGPLSHIAERASTEQTWLDNPRYAYMINVTVGTPGQPVTLAMSVSSPHTWVPDAGARFCLRRYSKPDEEATLWDPSHPAPCGWGTYNSTQSSTYSETDESYRRFYVSYADGTLVEGTNITDRLVVNDVVTDNFFMGNVLSNTHQTAIGILGLGINDPERSLSTRSYPSFIDRVVSSGKIASPAYSIWLDGPEGATGSLLLGAIDLNRFTGPLIRLQAGRPTGYRATFSLPVHAVSSSGKRLKDNGRPFIASLNPGDAFSYLPSVLADSIMEQAGATWDDRLKRAMIPCDAASQRLAEFEIELEGLGGPVLRVQLADLIVPRAVDFWRLNFVHGVFLGPNECLFGVQKVDLGPTASITPFYNIGSSLLRRTYMVFDITNDAVALAATNFPGESSESPHPSVVAFERFGATIPSSTLFPCGDDCRPACSVDGGCTEDRDENRRSRTGAPVVGEDDSGSVGRTMAIAIVVPFGVIALVVGALVVLLRRRNKKRAAARAAWIKEAESDVDGSDHAKERISVIDFGMRAPGMLSMVREESHVSGFDEKKAALVGEQAGTEAADSASSLKTGGK